MDPAVARVQAAYDRIGDRYHEWSSARHTRLAQVQRFDDRLVPGSLVLDLGCGPGDPATRVLAERHRVVGTDLSWQQLQVARRHTTAPLVQADMTRLALRPQSLDAVVSLYATGHLPPAEHAPLYRRIADWLVPFGLLLVTAPRTNGAEYEDDWLGERMYFGGIGVDATLDALHAAGLTIETAEVIEEDDVDAHFLWVTATRSDR